MSKARLFCMAYLILCRTIPANCQYYFYNNRYYDALFTLELGASAGAMNCLTDLGGRHETGRSFLSDLNRSATHPCAGLFAGVNYNNTLSLRAEMAWGQVSACDSILRKYTAATNGRYIRNLDFCSEIREVSVIIEWYPLSLFPNASFSPMPYVAAGVGYFGFHPQTIWNNSLVDLPALHTEGQGWAEYPDRSIYKLTQFNIPLGAGIKYEINPLLSIRGEIIYRYLFTDYLDDVSTNYITPARFTQHLSPQLAALAARLADRRRETGYPPSDHQGEIRGNSNKDAYFSINIKCSLVMGRKRIR